MTEIASFFAPAAAPASGGAAVASGKSETGSSVFATLLAQLQDGGTQGTPATASGTGILQQLESLIASKPQASSKIAAQLSASALLDEAASATSDVDAATLLAGQNATVTALNTTQLSALLQAQIAAQGQPTPVTPAALADANGNATGKPELSADQLAQLKLLGGEGVNATAADPAFARLIAGAIASHGQPNAQSSVTSAHKGQATIGTDSNQGNALGTNGNPGQPQASPLDSKTAIASSANASGQQNAQQQSNPSLDFSKSLDTAFAGQTGYVPVQPGFAAELMQAQTTQPGTGLQTPVPLDALAVQIARKFDEGSSQFEISLHPAELGKLDISLNVSQDGRVHAVLRAERAETLDLLRQDARSLETQLRQAGLDVGSNSLSFQLSQGGNQRQQAGAYDLARSFSQDETSASADIVKTSYVAVRKRDGLDIHV